MVENNSILIAVIEDAEDVLDAVKIVLENQQWSTNTFTTGEAFLADFDRHIPDYILLDPHLPEMSGVEVAKAIKTNKESIPIIVLTAQPNSPMTHELMKLGALEVLIKPVSEEVLISAIKTATHATSL